MFPCALLKEFLMLTIGQLAKQHGLSRGTLLYYDAIGLLKPSVRTEANYRLYTEEDQQKLKLICLYRSAGIQLSAIAGLLKNNKQEDYQNILQERLKELSEEIAALQEQQHLIVRILEERSMKKPSHILDKQQWIALLRAAGLDDDGMYAWHREYEMRSGHAHHQFLRSLGISEAEIKRIRAWSKG